MKGDVKYEVQWGDLYNMMVKFVNVKKNVKGSVNIETLVNYL